MEKKVEIWLNIINKIKTLFIKKKNVTNKTEEKYLVTFNTDFVYIPKMKDLTKEELELVKKYINEINLDSYESILTYSCELISKSTLNTSILVEYLYNLKQIYLELKDKRYEKLLEKTIELKILQAKSYLINEKLLKIQQDVLLRTIAIQEVNNKYNSLLYELLGIFGENKKTKLKDLKEKLSEALERMKIFLITMEMQRLSIDKTLKDLLETVDLLTINNVLKSINQDEFNKKKLLTIKVEKLEKIFKALFEEELVDKEKLTDLVKNFSNQLEQELINRISVLEFEIDKYVYQNKDKIPSIIEDLKKIEITKERREENLKKLEKYQVIFNLLKNQITEEDKKLLYEKKFYTLVSNIDSWECRLYRLWDEDFEPVNPFPYIKNQEEMRFYKEIFYEEYQKFLDNKLVHDEFTKEYMEIIKKIKEKVNASNFIWWEDEYFLKIIFVVNYPELFKKEIMHTISRYLNKIGFKYDYQLFEYEINEFLCDTNNCIYIDKDLVFTYLKFVLIYMVIDISKKEHTWGADILATNLLLLFGKYNSKKTLTVEQETLKIENGIKRSVIDNRIGNSKSLNLIFTKLPHSLIKGNLIKMELPKTLETFEGLECLVRLDRIQELNIPAGIKIITRNTLENFVDNSTLYTGLRKVSIEEGVLEIHEYAFIDCMYLQEIYLPKSLKFIDKTAFKNVYLKKVYYHPDLIDNLGYDLFNESCIKIEFIPVYKYNNIAKEEKKITKSR